MKKINKAVSALKEDRQAFGLLLGKGADLYESFEFPITTYPLSISTPEGKLRGAKHLLRNYLISEADAIKDDPIINARWIYDAMAMIRSLKPKETYKHFMANLLRLVTPAQQLSPMSIEIINDIYYAES